MSAMEKDAELIRQLGGPAALAQRLGYDKANGGVQRVQNWIKRGIPPAVKVEYPELFLSPSPDLLDTSPAAEPVQGA